MLTLVMSSVNILNDFVNRLHTLIPLSFLNRWLTPENTRALISDAVTDANLKSVL